MRPARALALNETRGHDVFDEAMGFVAAQFELVERVYQLDHDGKLSPGRGDATEGREFISGQLLKGGQLLGDLWFTAWKSAPVDTFLRGELAKRAK